MFAGIGGFRTGLTNAGDFFMPVGWCEKDKHAQKAYRLLYGTEGEYFCDDARIINPADMPDFDLICGGFPCQPFSVAGQRLGFADERGTLFHEICRLAEARHPKYLLLENVSGLLTHEGGQTFLAILTALEQLGYSLEWCVVNSANFGVPQDRKIACDLLEKFDLEWCEVQIGYAIGMSQPVSLSIRNDADMELFDYVTNTYDLTPAGIIRELDLLHADYETIAEGCHFYNKYNRTGRWK